jgi:flagellar hook assembly protein FlgD
MSTVLNGLNGNASSTSSADAAVAGNGTSTSDTANMFLKLLVAQIRNQDPLDPKDSSEYVNQLNQLSQTQMLESMVSQNRSSASMLEGLQVLAMGAQVGSTVTVTSSTPLSLALNWSPWRAPKITVRRISSSTESATSRTGSQICTSSGAAAPSFLSCKGSGEKALRLKYPSAQGYPPRRSTAKTLSLSARVCGLPISRYACPWAW